MARMSSKSATFRLFAPAAKKVSVCGSFNDWSMKGLSAKKDAKGNWTAKVSLKPGRYEYKFLVDGNWTDDSSCSWKTTNSFGSQNCILEIK